MSKYKSQFFLIRLTVAERLVPALIFGSAVDIEDKFDICHPLSFSVQIVARWWSIENVPFLCSLANHCPTQNNDNYIKKSNYVSRGVLM